MKVVQVNTYTRGGAALACLRLFEALRARGINSKALFRDIGDYRLGREVIQEGISRTLLSRYFYNRQLKHCWNESEVRKNLSQMEIFSSPFSPYQLHLQQEILEADIVHLHWIADFLDYSTFFKKRKRIVWTIHDLSPFLGGIHYTIDEGRISKELLKYELRLRQFKQTCIKGKKIHFVFLSEWLYQEACRVAPWLKEERCSFIYNPFPTTLFRPTSKTKARTKLGLPLDKKIILCVADYIHNYRKGFDVVKNSLVEEFIQKNNLFAISIGTKDNEGIENLHNIGRIDDSNELSSYYSAADLLVLPSRQDNLPNVMLESILCGCPVVSYRTGGMKEVITETNGVLFDEMSPDKLQNAIEEGLRKEFNRELIASEASSTFREAKIVSKYVDLYEEVLGRKKGQAN